MIIAVFEVAFGFVGKGFLVEVGAWILLTTLVANSPFVSCLFHCSSLLPRLSKSRLALREQGFLSPQLPVLLPFPSIVSHCVWNKSQTCYRESSLTHFRPANLATPPYFPMLIAAEVGPQVLWPQPLIGLAQLSTACHHAPHRATRPMTGPHLTF